MVTGQSIAPLAVRVCKRLLFYDPEAFNSKSRAEAPVIFPKLGTLVLLMVIDIRVSDDHPGIRAFWYFKSIT